MTRRACTVIQTAVDGAVDIGDPGPGPDRSRESEIKIPHVRLTLAVALTALVLIFALQNVAIVEVQFLFWSFRLPRSLLLFIVLGAGIIAGWFLRATLRRKRL